MTAQSLSLAVAAGLVLAAAAIGLFCLAQARSVLRSRTAASLSLPSAVVEVLQQKVETLEEEVRDLSRREPVTLPPALPRGGFNVEKRSQAIRMHRRGEPPSQIAACLDLPLQEVELLLKVHRIVLRNL